MNFSAYELFSPFSYFVKESCFVKKDKTRQQNRENTLPSKSGIMLSKIPLKFWPVLEDLSEFIWGLYFHSKHFPDRVVKIILILTMS